MNRNVVIPIRSLISSRIFDLKKVYEVGIKEVMVFRV